MNVCGWLCTLGLFRFWWAWNFKVVGKWEKIMFEMCFPQYVLITNRFVFEMISKITIVLTIRWKWDYFKIQTKCVCSGCTMSRQMSELTKIGPHVPFPKYFHNFHDFFAWNYTLPYFHFHLQLKIHFKGYFILFLSS